MEIHQAVYRILDEVAHTFDFAEIENTKRLLEAIRGAKRVFVAGAGRSGLMMRAFAMRLMQVGIDTYVVGETTTPRTLKDDILIVGSGSGQTGGPLSYAQIARSSGVPIFAITAAQESSLSRLAGVVIRLPAPTPKVHEGKPTTQSAQPLGSLFEQTLLVYLDALIIVLMQELGVDSETLLGRHATLQ
ncbi:MAG TPA: 6-phospho-3-hexuloisomerase [Planctomycetota bacterium]|nr:6-phospho-3-hexuloisomerase [Planctomycetota bacterium]